jgi:Zn-finger domain-containing protein
MDSELTKLRRARSRAHLALKQAEAQVSAYQAKLADLEARIQAIAPELQLPAGHREPNPIFARDELPRLALGIMREEGCPLPVAVITRRLLAAVTLPDRRTFKRTKEPASQYAVGAGSQGV